MLGDVWGVRVTWLDTGTAFKIANQSIQAPDNSVSSARLHGANSFAFVILPEGLEVVQIIKDVAEGRIRRNQSEVSVCNCEG
jgi:hypothetical protein